MLRKLDIAIVVGIATVLWALVLWYRGEAVTLGALGSFSLVVSVTFALVWLFDRFGWLCRIKGWCVFHGWLVACPDVRGTWEVELQSSWIDPKTEQGVPSIRCYYGVRQTCSTLQMHLMTPESESWLQVHRFVPSNKTNGHKLIAVYTNQPSALLRGVRSEIHHGTIELDFHGPDPSDPETFTGEYWTDRGTKGTMIAKRISSRVVSKHADGLTLSAASAPPPAPRAGSGGAAKPAYAEPVESL